jgi:hypothetical protein
MHCVLGTRGSEFRLLPLIRDFTMECRKMLNIYAKGVYGQLSQIFLILSVFGPFNIWQENWVLPSQLLPLGM